MTYARVLMEQAIGAQRRYNVLALKVRVFGVESLTAPERCEWLDLFEVLPVYRAEVERLRARLDRYRRGQ